MQRNGKTTGRRLPASLLLTLALAPTGSAQTTQGLIAGRVFDGNTREPIASAVVEYSRWEQGRVVETGSGRTNELGFYAFSFVPPGTYQLRVCVSSCELSRQNTPVSGPYQPQEIFDLELSVASRLEVNFALRKLTEVWKAGIQSGLYEDSTTAIVHYYASDVAQLRSAYIQLVPYRSTNLGTTVSYVVDPVSVASLPLTR